MRRTQLFLLSLVVVSCALRVCLLGHQELRGDEAFSWNYLQGTPAQILERIIREGDPQPPLHYWLAWGWAKFTGDSEFALRFPSVLLSVLLVPLMYQVGRKLWRAEIGLVAAGITALHPQQIWLAQDARSMYLLALVFLLIGMWLLPNLLHRRGQRAWIGYVACGLLAMYSHYYALLALIAHGGYVTAVRRNGWRWISAGLVIGGGVAPWALSLLPKFAQGQLADPGNLSFLKYTTAVFGELTAGPVFQPSTQIVIALVFVAVALIPLFTGVKWRLYLIAAIVVPFAGIYAIVGLRSTFNAYYFIFAFPAMYFLLADGLLVILKQSRRLGVALIAVGLIVGLVGLANHYFDPRYSKTHGWREVAAHITQASQPGDGYLANFPDPVQGYYLRRLNLPYAMLPDSPDSTPAEVDAALATLHYDRTWFAPIRASQWDRAGYVQARLLKTAVLLEDQQFDQAQLMLFAPSDRAVPLAARFADGVQLTGYTLTPDRLTLVWQAGSTPSTDYTVFVHALDRDGRLVAQHDAPPTPATSTWPPGQKIIDIHEFVLPTDQPLTLVAGMYLPAASQRLKLITPATLESDAALISRLNEK
jgi:4-amino-4-deoxy-L-arabinose transferase-like glycosyltransferase